MVQPRRPLRRLWTHIIWVNKDTRYKLPVHFLSWENSASRVISGHLTKVQVNITIVLEKLFANGLKHCKDNHFDFNEKKLVGKIHENCIFRITE